MKIRKVKFYQAVTIHDGDKYKTLTHLNLDKPEISGAIEMSVLENVGLLIETAHDSTIVTFNNIAYMHPIKEKAKPASSTKKS